MDLNTLVYIVGACFLSGFCFGRVWERTSKQ
jgi:hypothetical protein